MAKDANFYQSINELREKIHDTYDYVQKLQTSYSQRNARVILKNCQLQLEEIMLTVGGRSCVRISLGVEATEIANQIIKQTGLKHRTVLLMLAMLSVNAGQLVPSPYLAAALGVNVASVNPYVYFLRQWLRQVAPGVEVRVVHGRGYFLTAEHVETVMERLPLLASLCASIEESGRVSADAQAPMPFMDEDGIEMDVPASA